MEQQEQGECGVASLGVLTTFKERGLIYAGIICTSWSYSVVTQWGGHNDASVEDLIHLIRYGVASTETSKDVLENAFKCTWWETVCLLRMWKGISLGRCFEGALQFSPYGSDFERPAYESHQDVHTDIWKESQATEQLRTEIWQRSRGQREVRV